MMLDNLDYKVIITKTNMVMLVVPMAAIVDVL